MILCPPFYLLEISNEPLASWTNALSPSCISASNPSPSNPLSWGVGLLLTLPIGGARERENEFPRREGSFRLPLFKAALQNLLLWEESHRPWPCPCPRDLSIFVSAAFIFFLWLHSAQVWKLPRPLSDRFLLKIPSFEIPRVSSDFLTGSWQVKLVESPLFPPNLIPLADASSALQKTLYFKESFL